MAYEIALSPKAIIEIEEALNFYLKISHSVALNFEENLNKTFETIKINPNFQIRYKKVRAVPLNSFPYLVFFSIENEIIHIRSVFHTSQNPRKYPKP